MSRAADEGLPVLFEKQWEQVTCSRTARNESFTDKRESEAGEEQQPSSDKALNNPLFMKTNWILTLMWGILYLLTPIWTYLIMGTSVSSLTGAINSVLPALMGIFTAWFQKWYPAKVARGD